MNVLTKLTNILAITKNSYYVYSRIKNRSVNSISSKTSQIPGQQSNILSNLSQIPSNYSPRYQQTLTRKLIQTLKQKNRQQAQLIFSKQFYQNMQNQSNLSHLMQMKNSIQFYYRDYTSLIMNLQNQQLLNKENFDHDIFWIKKMLVQILSNHKQLLNTIKKYTRSSKNTYFSLYIKSLCEMILGQFKPAQKAMIQLLNTPFNNLIGNKQQYGNVNQQQQLMNTQKSEILNSKQHILFNLLGYKMYCLAEKDQKLGNQNDGENKAKLFYTKIKQKKVLNLSDLQLGSMQNYQNFLNLWISHKFDAPLQWTDLELTQKQQYIKYLYILAENYYLKKQVKKTQKILDQLPRQYPLCKFLQLSILYDRIQYDKLQSKFQELQKCVQEGTISYYKMPEFDIILVNLLKLMKRKGQKILQLKKKQQRVSNIKQNGQASGNKKGQLKQQQQQQQQLSQQQVQAKQFQYSIKMLDYNYNIKNMDSKGIPFYYLNIPFMDFMVNSNFRKCFL